MLSARQNELLVSPSSSMGGVADSFDLLFSDVSSDILEYENRKVHLHMIIDMMISGGPSWDGDPCYVDPNVATTAHRFLQGLPPNRELPKVAPDGEGDL